MQSAISDETDLVFSLPVFRLLDLANPVKTPPWENASELRPDMVHTCLSRRDFTPHPVNIDADPWGHARRIAWLIEHGWTDPICLEMPMQRFTSDRTSWPLTDGNHRLYAAAILGDATILTEISGGLDAAEEFFSIVIP